MDNGPYEIIEHGLQAIDSERRRVEDNSSDGLGVKNKELDIPMLDSQDSNVKTQKNLLEAGAAVQARLEL